MAPDRKRVAPETYWTLRRSAPTVRAWLSLFYPGDKTGTTWSQLWLAAEITDLELDRVHASHGFAGVEHLLRTSDTIEHSLSTIGAHIAYHRSGDRRMFDQLATATPPGASDVLPAWAITEARDAAKLTFQQDARTGKTKSNKKKTDAGDTSEEEVGGKVRRRKRNANKEKNKEKADPKGGGGGGGGKATPAKS